MYPYLKGALKLCNISTRRTWDDEAQEQKMPLIYNVVDYISTGQKGLERRAGGSSMNRLIT